MSRKILLTCTVLWLPPALGPSVALSISILACCCLNYFWPHRNPIVFAVANASYIFTALAFVSATILVHFHESESPRTRFFIGMYLILLDISLIFFALLAIMYSFLALKKKIKEVRKRRRRTKQIRLHHHGIIKLEDDGAGGLLMPLRDDDDGGKNEASPYPGPESGLSWDDYVRSVEIFNAGQRQHASRPQQAKRLNVEAVAINPFLAEAYLNLGIVSDTQEEVQEAYLNAARAAGDGRNDPVYTDALANLGHFLVEDSGRGHDYHVVEQAIAYYTQALRVTPEHQTTLYNLGIAYEVQGKRQEAYDTYRKVLAANQLHVGANLNSGNLLMYAGLFNLSLAFHERALRGYAELGGHDPWWQVGLLNNMGQTMIAQNDAVAALSYYREALALVEDEPMTLFNIFKARRSMCDWEGWSDTQVPRMIAMTTDDLYGSAAASSENKRVAGGARAQGPPTRDHRAGAARRRTPVPDARGGAGVPVVCARDGSGVVRVPQVGVAPGKGQGGVRLDALHGVRQRRHGPQARRRVARRPLCRVCALRRSRSGS